MKEQQKAHEKGEKGLEYLKRVEIGDIMKIT